MATLKYALVGIQRLEVKKIPRNPFSYCVVKLAKIYCKHIK